MKNIPHKLYRSVLSKSQKKIAASIEQARSAIPHAAEKGSSIENIIRAELKELLPYKIGVSHGFVIDSNGKKSKQMDIILYDKLNTPRVFSSPCAQIFPVESTYACGEIKTKLDGKELIDVFEKCGSYKDLERKSYFKEIDPIEQTYHLFGIPNKHWQSIFFCIAVETIQNIKILQTYDSLVREKNLDVEKKVDHICGLDGRSFFYTDKPPQPGLQGGVPQPRSIDLLPQKGRDTLCSYPAKEPWAFFINLLLRYMTQTEHPKINMLEYDDGSSF